MLYYIKTLKKTCEACPAQWEGTTSLDEPIYIRYRNGHLKINVNNTTIFSKFIGEEEKDENVKIHWDDEIGKKMIEEGTCDPGYKTMKQMFPNQPICFDGTLTLEELKKEVKDFLVI